MSDLPGGELFALNERATDNETRAAPVFDRANHHDAPVRGLTESVHTECRCVGVVADVDGRAAHR